MANDFDTVVSTSRRQVNDLATSTSSALGCLRLCLFQDAPHVKPLDPAGQPEEMSPLGSDRNRERRPENHQ